MIPTVLIVAVPLGVVFGMTQNRRVVAVGSIVTFFGWWALVLAVGGVEITLVVVLLASALALANLAVGLGVGWIGARLLRRLFGMTSEG
jgi:hypothetical protein